MDGAPDARGSRFPFCSQFEVEEEQITNRLQRQLEQVTSAYRALEARVEAAGLSPRALSNAGLGALLPPGQGIDSTTEWVYGRSPARGADRLVWQPAGAAAASAAAARRRSRSRSASSTRSEPAPWLSAEHQQQHQQQYHGQPLYPHSGLGQALGPQQQQQQLPAGALPPHYSASAPPEVLQRLSVDLGSMQLDSRRSSGSSLSGFVAVPPVPQQQQQQQRQPGPASGPDGTASS